MNTLEFRAMNTSVLLAAEGDEEAVAGLQSARAFIEVSEMRFSRFLPESELTQLNHSAGVWQSVSEDLMELLTLSIEYFNETGGLFNPSILPDLKRVGYDRSMEKLKTQTLQSPFTAKGSRRALTEIDFDYLNNRVRLPISMEIDLGGIAKGWIVERALDVLRHYASICAVSAGGDISFAGTPGASSWSVELEDPRDPNCTLATFCVGQCSVVTSSTTKRTWNQDGMERHHLIDPRTGEPAKTSWLSATVIDPVITRAEALAKAILIGGETEADRLNSIFPDLAYITVDDNGCISGSQTGKELIYDYKHFPNK